MRERLLVRIFVGIVLSLAILAFAFLPIPTGVNGKAALPAPALQQPVLYRMEVALATFYGGLLLLTPAFAGVARGRLPIEVSARGARFADSTDKAIDDLEQAAANLAVELSIALSDIELLKQAIGDKTEPPVASGR